MAPSVTPKSTHYALVIDAGSSGSRLQIYSWRDPDLERAEILQEIKQVQKGRGGKKWWFDGLDLNWKKWKGKGRADQVETSALRRLVRVGKGADGDDWVKRVEPGISNMLPEDIPTYLAPLLSHALQQIPPSQHSTTPIYVLATAGMRLLSDQARESILQATCDTLKSSYPFALPSCSENVRVISGEEEGMWGWVAVNYLMDGFGHAPQPTHASGASSSSQSGLLPLSPLAEPPPGSTHESVTPVDVAHQSPTFGFLDMGGASTQLAFSPTPDEMRGFSKQDLHKISLRLLSGEDVEWPVFVASWLGYGTNKVYEKYLNGLTGKGKTGDTIDDPCLPKGLTIPASGSTPSLKGTGSFSACLADLKPLLDHESACPTQHCLFGGVSTPYIDFEREDQRGFIGISEYWYTAQQVLGLGGVWDWGEWEKGMSEFCARDWAGIEKQVEADHGWLGAEIELHRLQSQCFKGAWISNVLHEGIGIPRLVDAGGNDTLTGGDVGQTNIEAHRRAKEKGLHHFQSMDEVGETAISWTLGKMVIEASKAVQPRSQAIEAAWTSALHLGQFETKLNDLGIQTVWAYGFITFAMVACIFNVLKRRFRWTWSFFPSSARYGRGRKPSISNGDVPQKWPWVRDQSDIEEGQYQDFSPRSTLTIGRLRLWSLKIGNKLRRTINNDHRPRGLTRHASMPLASTNFGSSASGNSTTLWSPPASPRKNGQFFTPADQAYSGTTSPAAMSPPRKLVAKARQIDRQASLTVPGADSGGWNDPPSAMLHESGEGVPSGVLTPTANGRSVHDPNSRPMSRQSSRVNLSELGLAQRNASRATTPLGD